MSFDWIVVWMLTGLRATGIVMLLPAPGGRSLPPMLRVACAMLIATLIAGSLAGTPAPAWGSWGRLVTAVAAELLLGFALGFVGRTIIAGAEAAGRMIANELGLMAAPGFDVPLPSQEPLPSFVGNFACLMFFVMGGHYGALAAFARSFDLAPAGAARFSPIAGDTLVTASAFVIELGLRLAAPFIALNFVITMGFSILGRAVPRMNVFIISYPVRTIMGFSMLAGAGALFARYLANANTNLPWWMLELVGGP